MRQCRKAGRVQPAALNDKVRLDSPSLQNLLGFFAVGIWAVLLLFSCASAQITEDLSAGAEFSYRWELVTVQSDFIGKSDFLALTEIDGKELQRPLVFDLAVLKLGPGEHRIKLKLGKFESPSHLAELTPDYNAWKAEIGEITLQQPTFEKGRNYLVASYDRIYTSNTNSPQYMQIWEVKYPRTIDTDKIWSIQSLDPETKDLASFDLEPAEAGQE